MKIKIPFTNKQVILDPLYEGLFFMLGIYTLFVVCILAMAALGPAKLCTIVGVLILLHMFKTMQIKDTEIENVKE